MAARTLILYRILAYTTGVVLLIFTAEIVLKYGFHVTGFEFIAIVHGWIYMFYFLVSVYLAVQMRWSWRWTVPVVLAGTIPFASFVAERKVVAKVHREHPELASIAADPRTAYRSTGRGEPERHDSAGEDPP